MIVPVNINKGNTQTNMGVDLIRCLSNHKPAYTDSPKLTNNCDVRPAYFMFFYN